MRVEAMSEIQASPWLGEVEVCDCGIWSFSFPFFIFWYIGLKVCNTLALSFCAARLFESSLWLLILDESFLVAALPPACLLLYQLFSQDKIGGVMGDHRKILQDNDK